MLMVRFPQQPPLKILTVVSGQINPDWDCLQVNHVDFFQN
jgi:hypothetical protein